MLRRKIRSPNLWIESRVIGTETQTKVAVAYVKGIASEDVVEEVQSRLDRIDIDGILESNYIEEFIQDKQFTAFPTVFNTERPDVVAGQLLEGRIAILVDGTPFALVVPALFTQFFQSPEDYYQRSDFASLIRGLRFLAFFLAVITPSFYIAITTFQQELLPTTLLFNLASQREGVPFPAFLEGLLMEIVFEILREASVRMPKTVGQSISIVGTLVVGQAAVEAGLVTAAMVIVVSITAISNFVMPSFNMGISARILRFFLMALGATFGLYGLFLGVILLVVRLCSLQSFGVPYMSPLAPVKWSDQKDTLFRVPFPWMRLRPRSIPTPNRVRQRRIR
jgi:spore germination protein KA